MGGGSSGGNNKAWFGEGPAPAPVLSAASPPPSAADVGRTVTPTLAASSTLLTEASPNTATLTFRGKSQNYRTNLAQPASSANGQNEPVPSNLIYGTESSGSDRLGDGVGDPKAGDLTGDLGGKDGLGSGPDRVR